MKRLQTLIQSCYDYGINPLPSLRKCFPGLKWKYWKTEGTVSSGKAIEKKLAAEADFVFPVSKTEFVSASKGDRRLDMNHVFFLEGGMDSPMLMPRRSFILSCIIR
jgi:hypothetical protein